MQDITMMSMQAVGQLLRERRVSPVEVLDACLRRTKALNDKLNAYVYLMEDEARAAARAAEKEIGNRWRGPLHGIPVGIKDLFYTKGVPTTGGSELLRDFIPDHNSTVVQRLIDAGGIVTGKLNMHEWAFGPTTEESCFGPCHNPWDPQKISGGSSGGSGVAVATGMAYMATGSDTGGSIRIPAAMCGIVGFKPSYGLVSLYGTISLSFTMDHPGPLCRSVMDAALAMDAITGFDPLDPCPEPLTGGPTRFAAGLADTDDLKGKKIGLPENFFFDKADEDVERLIREAARKMSELGAEIVPVNIPALETVPETSTVIMFSEAAYAHREKFAQFPGSYHTGVRKRLEQGNKFTAVDYINAMKDRAAISRAWAQALSDIDAVIAPTCPIPAYDIGRWDIVARGKPEAARDMCVQHTRLANIMGIPALSVPCGLNDEGLPVGLMIMGRRNDDLNVLQTGYAYEKHNPFIALKFPEQ